METKLAIDRYIDQIAVIADERKFVSALIVPVYGFVKDYAKEKGIAYNNMDELLQHSKIQALFRARIDTLQQQLPIMSKWSVSRFCRNSSMERGELTEYAEAETFCCGKELQGADWQDVRGIDFHLFVFEPSDLEWIIFIPGRTVCFMYGLALGR